jgi:STE24 endopeptidase
MIVIGLPVLGAVIWLVRMGGPNFYFYVWLFLCVISIIMMMVYPTVIAPLFNTYTKLEDGPIYTAIEKLANQVSFPLTQIYVVDGSKRSSHSNAYFYGFFGVGGSKSSVLLTIYTVSYTVPCILSL